MGGRCNSIWVRDWVAIGQGWARLPNLGEGLSCHQSRVGETTAFWWGTELPSPRVGETTAFGWGTELPSVKGGRDYSIWARDWAGISQGWARLQHLGVQCSAYSIMVQVVSTEFAFWGLGRVISSKSLALLGNWRHSRLAQGTFLYCNNTMFTTTVLTGNILHHAVSR